MRCYTVKSGIYYIKNLVNSKIYIGQTYNLTKRLSIHKCKLKEGKHENSYLQRSVKKYGITNFEFKILEYVEINKLDEREIYWINYYESTSRSKGYNIEGGGRKNKEISDEMRLMKLGDKNPMYGKHHSKKVINKMINSSRGKNNKLNAQEVEEIKIALYHGKSQQYLANKYNVDHTTINKIQTGANWGYIREDLNDYLKQQNKIGIRQMYEQIKNLFNRGISIHDIVNEYGYDYRAVKKATGKTINQLVSERNERVKEDFLNGMSKKDLIKKYNLSEYMYKDATKEAREEKNKLMKAKALELRKKGTTVKEIANLLNKHRTTITEWTKGSC